MRPLHEWKNVATPCQKLTVLPAKSHSVTSRSFEFNWRQLIS